jgi:hypothetical protein
MYRVSPLWFVTKEHIISDSVATSSSSSCSSFIGVRDLRFSSLSLAIVGDVRALCGVREFPSCFEAERIGEDGMEFVVTIDAWRERSFLSVSFFSSSPRSVASLPSSPRSPRAKVSEQSRA